MKKIIFVCLGNICRSPTAQLVFENMLEKNGMSGEYAADSFGTSDEEEGNRIYPPAAAVLRAHGIAGEHIAKRITPHDVDESYLTVVMDESNRRDVLAITHYEFADRVYRLFDFTDKPRDVIDPWYTRNFERAYTDIEQGCAALIEFLKKDGKTCECGV